MPRGNADLTLAMLLHATASLESGDWAVLRDMNFGALEIKALERLRLADVVKLVDQLDGHVLNITLDRERFWIVLDKIEAERASDRLKSDLVCREAPVDMMRHLFGMTDRQYARLRRRYRCSRGAGRPADPAPEIMDTIWEAWQTRRSVRSRCAVRQEWPSVDAVWFSEGIAIAPFGFWLDSCIKYKKCTLALSLRNGSRTRIAG